MKNPRSFAVGTIALGRSSQGRLVAGAKPNKEPFTALGLWTEGSNKLSVTQDVGYQGPTQESGLRKELVGEPMMIRSLLLEPNQV